GEADAGADEGAGRGAAADAPEQRRGRLPVAAAFGAARPRAGVPAAGGVPDVAGAAEVPPAPVRGAGEDAGGPEARPAHLREGAADVPPHRGGECGRAAEGEVALAPPAVHRRRQRPQPDLGHGGPLPCRPDLSTTGLHWLPTVNLPGQWRPAVG